MGKYISKFEKEEIDSETFMELTEVHLKDMGLPIGPRRKILKYIRESSQNVRQSNEDLFFLFRDLFGRMPKKC